jgi:hypothetical protein
LTDWTVVWSAAIAGSSAVVGGAIGYLTALAQNSVELKRIEAETERTRIQYEEAHLSHRQAVYHNFLDSAHRFHQDVGGVEPMTVPEMQKWLRDFEHRLTAVSLFGTGAAWRAAQRLANLVFETMGDDPKAYEVSGHEKLFLKTWDEVIEAMRPDAAPR